MLKILFALVLSAGAFAQEKDFSSWRKFTQGELIAETTALAPGASGTLGLHIKLEKTWHTYWLNPGDSGAPARLGLRAPKGVTVKRVLFPYPERIESGPLISFAYSDEALFLFEVEVDGDVPVGKNLDFSLEAEWLVCAEVCIPAIDTLKLSVPVRELSEIKPGPSFALFQKTRAMVPVLSPSAATFHFGSGGATLAIPAMPAGHEYVDFFSFRKSGVGNEKPQLEIGSPPVLRFKEGTVVSDGASRVGVLLTRDRNSGVVYATQFGDSGWKPMDVAPANGAASAGWMLLWAFLGGMILNLMPCVFPILSIKLLSLMKLAASHRGEVRRQNLAYVVGVLVSFVGIALVLYVLRSAGHFVGWGFQLQSPVFLSVLSWLFFILSLNLLGVFEVDFLDAGFGHRWTRLGGLWGSFFTGVLAVVVASPCTAPFMGVALGFGLTQSWWMLLAIFTMLGLGLSSPYLVFAIFPSWIRVLPRPGKWMNVVKGVMAVPLLLTTLWLLWILEQVRGMNAVVVVLAGCVALGIAVWASAWRKRLAQGLAAALILGGSVYIYRAEKRVEAVAASDVWQPYSESTMDKLKGQRVFVNMTADWCLTCKVNERLVFNDEEVQTKLAAKKVIWVKGDWTQRNEEITRFLTRYERVGVPFYVLYSEAHPDGIILPEVLTKNTFLELVEKEFP